MPNKDWQKLNELDRALRRAHPTGMNDGTHVVIELFSGFELFNTRPYHNYETWSEGYRITGTDKDGKTFCVEKEDLDDAIAAYIDIRNNPGPHKGQLKVSKVLEISVEP